MSKQALLLVFLTATGCTSTSSQGVVPDPAGGGGSAAAANAGAGGAAAQGGAGGAAGGAQAGASAAGGATAHDCNASRPGPKMVEIPVPGGKPFCIDSTKVTLGQYQEFMKAKADDVSGQAADCAWNMTFAPNQQPSGQLNNTTCLSYDMLATSPENPMWCADWCDAVAYCKWAGKRLCSGLGGQKLDPAVVVDSPVAAELTFACSQGGKTKYPYGDVFDAMKSDPSVGKPLAEKTKTESACHGASPPFDGVSGLMTEIHEWEDGCSQGSCRIRGQVAPLAGPPDPMAAACASVSGASMSAEFVAFRCCAD